MDLSEIPEKSCPPGDYLDDDDTLHWNIAFDKSHLWHLHPPATKYPCLNIWILIWFAVPGYAQIRQFGTRWQLKFAGIPWILRNFLQKQPRWWSLVGYRVERYSGTVTGWLAWMSGREAFDDPLWWPAWHLDDYRLIRAVPGIVTWHTSWITPSTSRRPWNTIMTPSNVF
jgi:hypothetical protein